MPRRNSRARHAAVAVPAVVVAAVAIGAAAWGAGSDQEVVGRVIDGDTFVTATGTHVRVLGIDACETHDPAGPRATALARSILDGKKVVLSTEPGHETDRYGRALRYVSVPDADGNAHDLGTAMVQSDAVAVYAGRNDANAGYVASLTAADPNGRDCSKPAAP